MFRISDVKEQAKNRLSGEWGSGILYVIGPAVLAMIFMMIYQRVFDVNTVTELYLQQFVSTVVNTVATFMTVNLLIQFVRYDSNIDFLGSVGPGSKLGKFFVYQLLMFVVSIVLSLVLLFTLFGSILSESEMLFRVFSSNGQISQTDLDALRAVGIKVAFFAIVMWVVMLVIQVRFMFTPYVIINEHLGVIDAMTRSWEISKGSFFKIILFQLSFILWFFLGVITCLLGFLYVLPYYQTSITVLYFELGGYDIRPTKIFEEKVTEAETSLFTE